MTTLESFIRTGALGPLAIGKALSDLIHVLGEPEGSSKRSNPLLVKYGAAELLLLKSPQTQLYTLRDIAVKFQPVFAGLPEPIAFSDWNFNQEPSEKSFAGFLERITYSPIVSVEGVAGRQMIFASGVTVLISSGMLNSIRYFEREAKKSKGVPFSDSREPDIEQIREMLDEAEQVSKTGAHRAALLLAWAALEATLRRRVQQLGRSGKIGLQPAVLIHELFATGALTRMEHEKIEQLRQRRSSVAHGLAPIPITLDDLMEVRSLVTRLLNEG
jgi:hypothetical protein